MRKSSISLKRDTALSANRTLLLADELVYVLVADKRLKYSNGRSRIAYIGTTKNGRSRVAQSVAWRANQILELHGVWSFEARIVTCAPRENIPMWRKLEQALLITFRETLGSPPHCNIHGKGLWATDHFDIFARTRLERIIHDLS